MKDIGPGAFLAPPGSDTEMGHLLNISIQFLGHTKAGKAR